MEAQKFEKIEEARKLILNGAGLNEALFHTFEERTATVAPLGFEDTGVKLVGMEFAPYGAAPLLAFLAEKDMLNTPVILKTRWRRLGEAILAEILPQEVVEETYQAGEFFMFPDGVSAGWFVANLRGWGWLRTSNQKHVEEFLYTLDWRALKEVLRNRAEYVARFPWRFAAFLQTEVER